MITIKNKKNSTWRQAVAWLFVFLLTGSFLFGENVLAFGDYNKADGSRLDPAEWNGLVNDFVNTWQTASMTGPLGIGTADPAGYKLNVNGNTNITGSLTATTFNGSYVGTLNAANISSGVFGDNLGGGNFSFPGRVGIGTSNPNFVLDVDVGSDDVRFVGSGGGGLGLLLEDTASGGHGWYFNTNPVDGGFGINHAGATGSIGLPGTRVISALPDGNVGIGTADPGTYRLFVNGTSNLAGNTDIGGNTSITGTLNVTGVITGGGLTGVVAASNVSAGAFAASTGGGNFSFPANVGVGTTDTSLAKLQVKGSIFATGLDDTFMALDDQASPRFGMVKKAGYAGMFAHSNNSNFIIGMTNAATINPSGFSSLTQQLVINTSGNVGVGTISPAYPVSILRASGTAGYFQAQQLAGETGILFGLDAANLPRIFAGETKPITMWTGGTERFRIDSSGNVGIGTTSPTAAKLVINAGTGMALKAYGDGIFTGTLQTQTGSDFAEEFSTTENLEPGTVVVMGDGGYKSVHPCDKEYDTTVVGIVSNNPSIIAGRVISKHKAIIAMMGVVKVNVIDINGKISKGDRLTTSGISGYAMKADDSKPGTIIGKALEDLTKKSGEINVLVNLQ